MARGASDLVPPGAVRVFDRHEQLAALDSLNITTTSSMFSSSEPASDTTEPATPGSVVPRPASTVAPSSAVAVSSSAPPLRARRSQKLGRSLLGTFHTAFMASCAVW